MSSGKCWPLTLISNCFLDFSTYVGWSPLPLRIGPNPCELKKWAHDPILLMGRWLGQARRGCGPAGQTGRWFPFSLWMRSLWYWGGDNHLHLMGGWGPVREGAGRGCELHLRWNGLLLCDLMHCPPFRGFITRSQSPLRLIVTSTHCLLF